MLGKAFVVAGIVLAIAFFASVHKIATELRDIVRIQAENDKLQTEVNALHREVDLETIELAIHKGIRDAACRKEATP